MGEIPIGPLMIHVYSFPKIALELLPFWMAMTREIITIYSPTKSPPAFPKTSVDTWTGLHTHRDRHPHADTIALLITDLFISHIVLWHAS